MACMRKIVTAEGTAWRIDWRDKAGNRYRKTFATKKAAEDDLDTHKQAVRDGSFIAPKQIPTLKAVAEDWFALKAAQGYRAASLQFWRGHLDNYLLPAFGDRRIDHIDVALVERWARQLTTPKTPAEDGVEPATKTKPLAPKTVNKLLTTLAAIFKFAIKRKYVRDNPATVAERLRVTAGEIGSRGGQRVGAEVREDEVLSTTEIEELIKSAAPGFYQTLLMTAAATGARHDELLALQWSQDLDLEAGELTIQRSLSWAKAPGDKEAKPRFYDPKTSAGYRKLRLPPKLVLALKKWKLQCPKDATGKV